MAQFDVVIIGAGVSGISAVKSCLEEQLSVVCYEQNNSFGGTWLYTGNSVHVAKNTVLNSSKEWSTFSDLPMPAHFPNFLSHEKYREYLKLYVDKFEIEKHIHYHTQVIHVDKCSDYSINGHWKVTTENLDDGKTEVVEAGAVIVCRGPFQQQKVPNIAGLDQFKGKVVLSRDYKTSDEFKDLRVAIIGSGNTAYDMAVELGKVAKAVYLARRRSGKVFGRLHINGLPLDRNLNRAIMLASKNVIKWFGLATFNWILSMTISHCVPKIPDLEPAKDFYFRPVIINDEIAYRAVSNEVMIKNPVKVFHENTVTFEDEENKEYPIDVAIIAVGYKPTINGIFDSHILNDYQLVSETYLHVFPMHLTQPRPSLAFVGKIQLNGAAAPIFELQSRWIAQVLKNNIQLPSQTRMKNTNEELKNRRTNKLNNEISNHEGFFPYADELANEFGAKPQQLKLFLTDFKLWWMINFGPALAAQFRLNGPHRCANARETIFTSKQRVLTALNATEENTNHTAMLMFIIVAAMAIIYTFFI